MSPNEIIWLLVSLPLLFVPSNAVVSSGQSAVSPCMRTEKSIFHDVEPCAGERAGSLTKGDVTVAGFAIGRSTLADVKGRFPAAKELRLTEGEEAAKGICVKNGRNQAVVFASGPGGGWDILDAISSETRPLLKEMEPNARWRNP